MLHNYYKGDGEWGARPDEGAVRTWPQPSSPLPSSDFFRSAQVRAYDDRA